MSVLQIAAGETPPVVPASVDLVISTENVIRWEAQFAALGQLKAIFHALKARGVLGIVESRAPPGATFRQMLRDGKATEEHVVSLAEVAGFRLAARSDVNNGAIDRMTLKFVKP